ncbi:MAG: V0D/AC39 family V-type ATPase subunit [Planctomycetota bacterium]|jgi:vacuolar-type H+-ATPase subunit C/Vma6
MFSAGINGYNVARGLFGALKTRAPRPELIDQLLDQADMTGCLAALKNLPLVESIPTGQGPAEMETALRYACAVLALKIRRVLGGPAGRFLEAYTWHYDFHNIKLIFRSSLDGGVFDLPSGLYPLGEVYSIGPLKKIGAPEDLPTYFAETPLAPAVNEAWELFAANNSDLSLFELGLDKWYVNLVWNAAEHVRPTEGSRLRDRILAPWLGMVCLLWVLWLKNFRSMGVEEIVNLLDIPPQLLTAEDCVLLVERNRPAALAGRVSNRPLREFLETADLPSDVSTLHRLARRFVWRTISPAGLTVMFDISTLLRALMRWELIVEDAITVTSARSMGLEREDILPLLATKAA